MLPRNMTGGAGLSVSAPSISGVSGPQTRWLPVYTNCGTGYHGCYGRDPSWTVADKRPDRHTSPEQSLADTQLVQEQTPWQLARARREPSFPNLSWSPQIIAAKPLCACPAAPASLTFSKPTLRPSLVPASLTALLPLPPTGFFMTPSLTTSHQS